MTLTDGLFIAGLIIVALVAWLFVPTYMMKRAMPKVIEIFRKHNAVGILNAKTLDDLGLGRKALWKRMWGRRDYKPRALDFLVQTGIIQMTDEGKVYLSEMDLAKATWLKLPARLRAQM
jgi:hypothetical protein